MTPNLSARPQQVRETRSLYASNINLVFQLEIFIFMLIVSFFTKIHNQNLSLYEIILP